MKTRAPRMIHSAVVIGALFGAQTPTLAAQAPASIRSEAQQGRSIAALQSVSQSPGGEVRLRAQLTDGEPVLLQIEFQSEHIVRVRASQDGRFEPTLQERDGFLDTAGPGGAFYLRQDRQQVRLETDGLTVQIRRSPFQLAFYQGDRLLTGASAAGLRLGREQALLMMDSPAEEKFLGFGDQGSRHGVAFPPDRASLDKRGRQLLMAGLGSNRIYYTPFFLSSQGYGFFLNTLAQSDWDLAATAPERYVIQLEEPRLDFFVIAGPSFSEILERYTAIVGRPPLLPTWTMGGRVYPQLRGQTVNGAILDSGMGTRWFEQEEILARASAVREARAAVDFTYIDSAWQTVRNSFDWVPNIPDPERMLDSLRRMNFHVLLWQRSTPVKDDYSLWHEAVSRGFLVRGPDGEPFISPKYGGPSGMIDFTNPEAVAWWQARQSELGKLGVSSYKLDSAGSAFLESHPEVLALRFHNGMTGKELDNYYGPLYLKTVWDGLRRDLGGERAVLFTYHSTYFAGGRFPFLALGDRTNKSTLDLQIRYALNYGLSGVPFWQGGEISSFAVPFVDADLQARLRPYSYTAWRDAHERGLPVVRAMVLEDRNDAAMYEADLQFLFGPDLLVAPLVKGSHHWRASFFPDEGPQTERVGHRYVLGQMDWQRVYIPRGEWIHYWTQQKYRGPGWRYFRPENGHQTLLVRGGAILPLGPLVEYAGQKPLDPLTLEIYPSGESSFRLYEDDGRTYAYEAGAFATTEFRSRETGEGIEIELGPTQGSYAGQPSQRSYVLQVRGTTRPSAVRIGGQALRELRSASEWETAQGEIFETTPTLEPEGAAAGWEAGEAGWYYHFRNGYDRTVFVSVPALPAGQGITVTLEGAAVVRYYMD